MTANLFNIDLTTIQYILIVCVTTVATISMAGSPGTASIITIVVLMCVGLPLQGLILVMSIDKIVDMMRTLTNVTGGAVVTLIVNWGYKEV